MKKYTIFIFCSALLLIIKSNFAYSFFIPEYEKQPRYEKIPPLIRTNNTKTSSTNLNKFNNRYEIEKYILVNGVYSPVYKKKAPKRDLQTPALTERHHPQVIQNVNTETVKSPKNEEITQNQLEQQETELNDNDFPKELGFTPINSSLPKYKNVYNQYLLDTKIFKQNGKFPQNKELDISLEKMNSNDNIILYSETLNIK